MGRVAEVKYDSIVKEKDNGILFQFGDRAIWIHVGHFYRHDRQRCTIMIPESVILDRLLDQFKVATFSFTGDLLVNKISFELLEVRGGKGKAKCLRCDTVFDFEAPNRNCMMVQKYEVVPVCPTCSTVPEIPEKEPADNAPGS